MKSALIALVLGLFTVSVAVHANEAAPTAAAPTEGATETTKTAKRTKKTKHKKDGSTSTEVKKEEKTTSTEETAPVAQ